MKELAQTKILIDRQTVEGRIGELACEIAADYPRGCPLFVGVLNGAAQFMMALISRLPEELQLRLDYDFVDVSSYDGRQSSGRVQLSKDLNIDLQDRDLIVVEGIVDTGLTLDYLLRKFAERHPRSIRICSLLDKKARRKNKLEITYCGFAIDDLFVVGYGMDCDQRYRALHHIAVLE